MPLAELLALLAPPVCATCRAPLGPATALVCPACLRALRWLGEDGCRRCGLPTHGGRRCPATRAAFDTAWAPLAYEGTARELVRALKFRGALPVAGLMAAQVAVNLPAWARGDATAIVPVPATAPRRRRRGFDPADLLAREVATRLDLPVHRGLRREGPAVRQLGARRAERRAAGRIRVVATGPAPERVLLVDDVHTTGATLDACARALRTAGARRIHAVTHVRAL
jgi:ComF family protein